MLVTNILQKVSKYYSKPTPKKTNALICTTKEIHSLILSPPNNVGKRLKVSQLLRYSPPSFRLSFTPWPTKTEGQLCGTHSDCEREYRAHVQNTSQEKEGN